MITNICNHFSHSANQPENEIALSAESPVMPRNRINEVVSGVENFSLSDLCCATRDIKYVISRSAKVICPISSGRLIIDSVAIRVLKGAIISNTGKAAIGQIKTTATKNTKMTAVARLTAGFMFINAAIMAANNTPTTSKEFFR